MTHMEFSKGDFTEQNLMAQIRDLVTRDPVALGKWTMVVDRIVKSELDKRKIKDSLLAGHFADAILDSLNIWHGYGSETLSLPNTLREYQLNSLAERVAEVLCQVSTLGDKHWPFRTIQVLGAGSFGVVVHAESEIDGCFTALKMIPNRRQANQVPDADLRESRFWARLTPHPNVVKYVTSNYFSLTSEKFKELIQWNADKSTYSNQSFEWISAYVNSRQVLRGWYLQMEVCGETLRQWLAASGASRPDKDKQSISRNILSALNFIHNQRPAIVHRDLRPDNIYFSASGFQLPVKVGDFGLSNQINSYEDATLTIQVGNSLYRAPEMEDPHPVNKGMAKYGPPVDLFSAGLIVSEIFDPVDTAYLKRKFDCIRFKRDTGSTIKSKYPHIEELILVLTEENPEHRQWKKFDHFLADDDEFPQPAILRSPLKTNAIHFNAKVPSVTPHDFRPKRVTEVKHSPSVEIADVAQLQNTLKVEKTTYKQQKPIKNLLDVQQTRTNAENLQQSSSSELSAASSTSTDYSWLFGSSVGVNDEPRVTCNSTLKENTNKYLQPLYFDDYERNASQNRTSRLNYHKEVITRWINAKLEPVGEKVDDIFYDLRDGRKLAKLLEITYGGRLEGISTEGLYGRLREIENVNNCLKFLHTKVRLESIGAEDIVDGNPSLTLGLLFAVIRSDQN